MSATLRIEENAMLLKGYMALKSKGRIVWCGPVGSPIEDAACDTVALHPEDAATMRRWIDEQGKSR